MLEVVADDKNNPEFKLLMARLYNAALKVKTLTKVFGLTRTTMKRWGRALKSNDPERLLRALAGAGAKRKLTPEITAFVQMHFAQIYAITHYDYSKRIRTEIKQVFGVSISAETLRLLLRQLKSQYHAKPPQGYGPDGEPLKRSMDMQSVRLSLLPAASSSVRVSLTKVRKVSTQG